MTDTLPITHFIVRGDARTRIDAIKAERELVTAKWAAFRLSHGAAATWCEGGMFSEHIVGLSFDGKTPPGWKPSKDNRYRVPDRKTAAGKAIAKQMAALPSRPALESFQRACMPETVNGRLLVIRPGLGTLHIASVEEFGETCVVGVYHKEGEEAVAPLDSEQIRESDYWLLREAAEAEART